MRLGDMTLRQLSRWCRGQNCKWCENARKGACITQPTGRKWDTPCKNPPDFNLYVPTTRRSSSLGDLTLSEAYQICEMQEEDCEDCPLNLRVVPGRRSRGCALRCSPDTWEAIADRRLNRLPRYWIAYRREMP